LRRAGPAAENAQDGSSIAESRREDRLMERSSGETKSIEAQRPLGIGQVQMVRAAWEAPIERSGIAGEHRLELALLPHSQGARACFPDLWGPHRFEPMGPLFLLPAQQRVHARSDCRQQQSIICSFRPEAVATWLGREPAWTHRRLEGSLNIVNGSIRQLLLRMGAELRAPGFASEALLDSMAIQLAVELSRHLSGIDEAGATGGLCAWRLRRIDERLAQDGATPTLEALAGLCHLSVRQLTRAFRLSRGCSIGHYIAEQRMERARRMLSAGLPVKAVAYTTGFTAPSNFAAAFLRATGETPRQYRERQAGVH